MKPLKHRPPDTALLERLKTVVGPKGWLDQQADLAPHLADWRSRYQGATPLLLKPASTEEVAAIVRVCAAAEAAIVPQGGHTGLAGGRPAPWERRRDPAVNGAYEPRARGGRRQ